MRTRNGMGGERLFEMLITASASWICFRYPNPLYGGRSLLVMGARVRIYSSCRWKHACRKSMFVLVRAAREAATTNCRQARQGSGRLGVAGDSDRDELSGFWYD